MNKELATLQGLLNVLDDARMFQCRVAHEVTHPYVRRLLDHATQVHLQIGGDLADRIIWNGQRAQRSGSLAGRLRAVYAKWLAGINFDMETVSIVQAGRCETRVLRRFRRSLADIRNPELQSRLRGHQRQIELVYLKLSQFGFLMQIQATPRAKREFGRHRIAPHAP